MSLFSRFHSDRQSENLESAADSAAADSAAADSAAVNDAYAAVDAADDVAIAASSAVSGDVTATLSDTSDAVNTADMIAATDTVLERAVVDDTEPAVTLASDTESEKVTADRVDGVEEVASEDSDSKAAAISEEPIRAEKPIRAEEPVRSTAELVDEAYVSWYSELSVAAKEAENLPGGTASEIIDITHPHPTGAAQLYSHTLTRLSSLIRETNALAHAKSQLARLQEAVRKMEESHGFAPISLSAGLISWTELPKSSAAENAETLENTGINAEEGSGEVIREAEEQQAAALYRRIRLSFLPDGDAAIQLSPQAEVNPRLMKALRENGITPEEIAELRELVQHSLGIEEIVRRLVTLSRIYLPGFRYQEQAYIGCFHNPAQIMLNDLEAMEPYIKSSGILAALAGDEVRRNLSVAPVPPGLAEDRSPEGERGVGDHDVAELDVIEAVASGRSLIIDTPPGTEKISTIAAIAADAAASGKSVIFVPASASAGRVLRAEMEKLGVGELVLDFSDIESVPLRIRTGLRLQPPEIELDAVLANRDKLVRSRMQLQRFIADLHRKDKEFAVSVYDILQKLAQLTGSEKAPKTRVRLPRPALLALQDENYAQAERDLERAEQLGLLNDSEMVSAWANSPLSDAEAGKQAFARAQELAAHSLLALREQVAQIAAETDLRPAENLQQWQEQLELFTGIADSLDIFRPHIFDDSPADMVAATASAEWRKAHDYKLSRGERRAIKHTVQEMLRPGVVPADLHKELSLVEERRNKWKKYAVDGGWPILPTSFVQARMACAEVTAELAKLAVEVGVESYMELSFPQLQEQLTALSLDIAQMENLAERNKLIQHFKNIGLDNFLNDLRTRRVAAEMLSSELDLAYTSSLFEQLLSKSEVLAAYGPRDLENMLQEFLAADMKHVDSLGAPVLLAAVRNMRETARAHRDDTIKMDKILASYGVTALRDMIATYPRIVQVARPVWILPAVMEAEYVPPLPWADLVIAELGDTSTVASTVSLLARGRQIVLVGDRRRAYLTGNEETALNAFAEVLPAMELPTGRVHYAELGMRALGQNGYEGVYKLLPSRPLTDTILLSVVDGRGVPAGHSAGAVEAPKAEVDAVVQAVLRYAIDQNPDSLAVVTASALHAKEIWKALSEYRPAGQYLSQLRHRNTQEPFTVVDISQVAGLQRDNIIFSPGFGKTVHGRVLHSFGQLATPQGFIGLVDTLNAARNNFFVVSSLAPGDIDLAKVSTPGPRLLAEILDTGIEAGGTWEAVTPPSAATSQSGKDITPLLADLAKRLEKRGWLTAFNYGYDEVATIPLVVGHKNIPGTWALAVLVDDAEYAAEASLRRRDRYRQEAFTEAGWLVYQTFSTSLFIDPAGQVQQIIDKIESYFLVDDGDEAELGWVEESLVDGEVTGDEMRDSSAVDESAVDIAEGTSASDVFASDESAVEQE